MVKERNEVKKPPLLVILGPTASGKSQTALKLAKIISGEIINADSRQIYKYCLIGTNSPEPDQLVEVPHHLYNFIDPNVRFSAAEYAKLSAVEIEKITKIKKIPILVGGSGLYIRALLEGLFPTPSANLNLRNSLKKIAQFMGKSFLHNQLKYIDPEAAKKIPVNDLFRIIRAIEIFALTGKSKTSLQKEQIKEKKYYTLKIGILLPKNELNYNIEYRINNMIKKGLLEEVNFLINNFGYDIPALQTIGYKELIPYLKKEISLEEAIALIKRNTIRYAKRQLTWFKADKEIIWKTKEECLQNSFINFIKNYFFEFFSNNQ